MLVYDVSDRSSFGNVEYWIKNIKAHASGSVHVALVGNKTDLRVDGGSGHVDYNGGKAVADRFNVPYFEVSAKENSNVDSAFMTVVTSIIAGDGEPMGKKAQSPVTSPTNSQAAKTGTGSVFTRAENGGEKKKRDCVVS